METQFPNETEKLAVVGCTALSKLYHYPESRPREQRPKKGGRSRNFAEDNVRRIKSSICWTTHC